MKKSLKIILAVVLVLLILAGGAGWAGYRYYRQAVSAQQVSYQLWQAMRKNAEASSVSVTELDEAVGTYDLKALGLLPAVLEKIDAQFDAEERMSAQEFEDLGAVKILLWMKKATDKTANAVTVDPTGYDGAAILADLQSVPRMETVDEAVYVQDDVFCYVAPVQGNIIDEQIVLDRVEQKLAAFVITPSAAASASVAITRDDYPAAVLLAEDEPHSAQELFERAIENMEIRVHIGDAGMDNDTEETMTADIIARVLTLRENGTVRVDTDGLQEIVHGWAEVCEKTGVPYVFHSYDDGPMELDFMKTSCDYRMDETALVRKLRDQLLKLESGDVYQEMTAYQNGEELELDDTYIEVNIDRQTITFYKDGELIVHSDIVTGNLNGHQTPVGIYHVQNFEQNCRLTGDDFNVFVKYWVGFNGAYGIHDAQWRNHFGGDYYVNNGSHGCVNTPDLAMEKIFENAEIGDAVIVHGKNEWYTPNIDPNDD